MIYKNWHELRPLVSIDWDPSLTEPEQSMSIQEILDRVSRGMTTGLSSPIAAEFDDEQDDDFDDPGLDSDFNELDARNEMHRLSGELERLELSKKNSSESVKNDIVQSSSSDESTTA